MKLTIYISIQFLKFLHKEHIEKKDMYFDVRNWKELVDSSKTSKECIDYSSYRTYTKPFAYFDINSDSN